MGIGERSPSSVSSWPRLTGCSMNSMPSESNSGMRLSISSRVHDWLASITSRACGASSRTTLIQSTWRVPSTLILMSDTEERLLARRLVSGMLPRPMVQAVNSGRMCGMPALTQAGTPERLACKSHKAQSTALRAPPRGNSVTRSSGVTAVFIRAATASICLRIDDGVSPS